jgi:hypothetical protein
MEGERRYKQRGYMDSERVEKPRDDRPRQDRPRLPIDITGPRLPRLVQPVTAARCYNCATTLASSADFSATCPKCSVALHCCKQCAHFEPSTRFQCLKPIPVRIPAKDRANDCTLFSMRVTVARDGVPASNPVMPVVEEPRSADDARLAFDRLFKK